MFRIIGVWEDFGEEFTTVVQEQIETFDQATAIVDEMERTETNSMFSFFRVEEE